MRNPCAHNTYYEGVRRQLGSGRGQGTSRQRQTRAIRRQTAILPSLVHGVGPRPPSFADVGAMIVHANDPLFAFRGPWSPAKERPRGYGWQTSPTRGRPVLSQTLSDARRQRYQPVPCHGFPWASHGLVHAVCHGGAMGPFLDLGGRGGLGCGRAGAASASVSDLIWTDEGAVR
jgi:hypothetical protein